MVNNRSNPIERWEKEEKQRKFRTKDEMAAKQAQEMVEAFKQENKKRLEQEKAESDAKRLKKKIDKCDGTNSEEISKLLDEIKNKYEYLVNEVPGYVQDSLENLLDRAEHIDKELMKKIIRFNNSNEGGISIDEPERWLSKCNFDDELIYNSIMAGYYKALVGLIDENKLEGQRKRALNDIKKYFYTNGFLDNRELFGLDYEEFPEALLEAFGDKGDLDEDFLKFIADNMIINETYSKYFRGMTDDEFYEKLLSSQFDNKILAWDEYDKMPNNFAFDIISKGYREDVLNHLEKFQITDELLYNLLNFEERDFQEKVLEKLIPLKKRINKEETLIIFDTCINYGILDFVSLHKEHFEMDYEVAKIMAERGDLDYGFGFGPEDFNVTDDQWHELLKLSYDEQEAQRQREEQEAQRQREEREARRKGELF